MLRCASGTTLVLVTLFTVSVVVLSSQAVVAVAASVGVWQVMFVSHVPEMGLVGRVMNLDGSDVQPVTLSKSRMFYLDCSPDGSRFIFAAGGSAYVADANGENLQQVEASAISSIDLSVSNDGQIIFSGYRAGRNGVYLENVYTLQGDEVSERLPDTAFGFPLMYDLSPDGSRLTYYTQGDAHLFVIDVDGHVLAELPGVAFAPDWSPDGTMVAFAADWDGNFEIYLLDVSRAITVQLTDQDRGYGNTFPAWTPDGREIMYVHTEATGLGSSYGGDLYITDGGEPRRLAHFQDEVVMGCLLTVRPASLIADQSN
jgi:Tol biopolymer transport system component